MEAESNEKKHQGKSNEKNYIEKVMTNWFIFLLVKTAFLALYLFQNSALSSIHTINENQSEWIKEQQLKERNC